MADEPGAAPAPSPAAELFDELRSVGELDSTGAFSIDPRHARDKLRKFQLLEPHLYVLYVVSAAVLAEASYLSTRVEGDAFVLEFDGYAFSSEQLDGLMTALLGGKPEPRVRELGLAVNAALALEPHRVEVMSWEGTRRAYVELGADMQSDAKAPPKMRDELRGRGTRVVVHEGRAWAASKWALTLGSDPPEVKALATFCQHAPLSITWRGTSIVQDADFGEPALSLTIEPVDAARHVHTRATLKAPRAAHDQLLRAEFPCRGVLLFGGTHGDVVDTDLVLNGITYRKGHFLGLNCRGVLWCPTLTRDISGGALVVDEQVAALESCIRGLVGQALERLSGDLTRWSERTALDMVPLMRDMFRVLRGDEIEAVRENFEAVATRIESQQLISFAKDLLPAVDRLMRAAAPEEVPDLIRRVAEMSFRELGAMSLQMHGDLWRRIVTLQSRQLPAVSPVARSLALEVRGLIAAASSNLTEAATDLEEAAGLRDDRTFALRCSLGVLYRAQGDVDEAERQYRLAYARAGEVRTWPARAREQEVWAALALSRGQVAGGLGRLARALACWRHSGRVLPAGAVTTLDAMAATLEAEGKLRRALPVLMHALVTRETQRKGMLGRYDVAVRSWNLARVIERIGLHHVRYLGIYLHAAFAAAPAVDEETAAHFGHGHLMRHSYWSGEAVRASSLEKGLRWQRAARQCFRGGEVERGADMYGAAIKVLRDDLGADFAATEAVVEDFAYHLRRCSQHDAADVALAEQEAHTLLAERWPALRSQWEALATRRRGARRTRGE